MRRSPSYQSQFSPGILFLIVVLCSLCTNLTGQVYKVMEYGVNSGLPEPYVYSMHQDHYGYLWIGTGDGLARYDGNSFRVFTTADSLCDEFVTSSHINTQGSWFGHMNGGVTHYNGETFTKVVAGNQGTGSITDIKSNGNTTWASTQSGGIWRIGTNHQTKLFVDPENPVSAFTFEFISPTECAVGSIDGVYLFAIENESNSLRFITILELPDTKIQDLTMSRDNTTLYILTQDEGIFTFNTNQFSPDTDPFEMDLVATGIERPQQIFEDSQHHLWIPTFGNGLFKLIPGADGGYNSWTNYSNENGLPDNNIQVVFEDREENIWLGMYGTGLSRLVDEAFTYYFVEETEIDYNIQSIYMNQDFKWFGTGNGLIRHNRANGETLYLSGRENGLPNDRVTAITGSPNGSLWIGSSENGVYRKQPGGERFRKIYISSGTLENSINALEFNEPFLWIATGKGVCKVDTRSGARTWFTISDGGLPHNTVNHLLLDRGGKVWLSTKSNTISYIENNTVTRLVMPAVGRVSNIQSITRDMEGNMWVGTDGNGVFKLEGDSAINYTTDDGLSSKYCKSLVGDDINYMWVGHKEGLSRIGLSDGNITSMKEEVGISRSMEFNQNAAFKDPDGILWFGSTTGVLSYNPNLAKSQLPPPAVSITSIIVNNQARDVVDHLQLRPGKYDLRIQFVGINLKNPDAVTYRYKMEGLGNSWVEEFRENQVSFNRLSDGKYIFNLSATNSAGIYGQDPVLLHITISKPLWKRWWFYGLFLVIVASGFVVYVKRREHNLLMEKQILEKAVKERTEEVVHQKEEIERQSDEIRLINKNITDSITYARRIQQAVFPPSEQLTSYFPKSFVMNRPQYIVSGDFFWVAKKEEKLIVTVADCTGHGVPGAFMSMLGITLLNEIVNNQHCVEADQILNKLKHEVIHALRQKGTSESASDGMDMALCVFDPKESKLQYAGGFNPLMQIRNGELIKYPADPMPIGIGAIKDREFTKHEFNVHKGDQIYLYSDGYEDQFGGEKDKKFSRQRFRKLLLDIHRLPMQDQKIRLENRLDDWMNGREQIDDITVLGIRF